MAGMSTFLKAVESIAEGYSQRMSEKQVKSTYSHSAPRPGRMKKTTDPKLSKWYTDYMDLKQRYEVGDKGRQFKAMSSKWRRRFRVPLPRFEKLLAICRDEGLGGKTDGRGRNPHPLELKVMGVLRVLGRSACFDDLEDSTLIDEDTHHSFFRAFTTLFATQEYKKWVKPPSTEDEINDVMALYTIIGLPGCVGSVDCVHIPWGMCPAGDKSWFDNGKEGGPTVVYEVVANRARRILAATPGHPGARNDKTTCRYDDFLTAMRRGLYQDVEFPLYDLQGNLTRGKGAYLICDGGYHQWRILQHGNGSSSSPEEVRIMP